MRTTGAARVIDTSAPPRSGMERGQSWKKPSIPTRPDGNRAAEPGMTTCCLVLCSDGKSAPGSSPFCAIQRCANPFRTRWAVYGEALGQLGSEGEVLLQKTRNSACQHVEHNADQQLGSICMANESPHAPVGSVRCIRAVTVDLQHQMWMSYESCQFTAIFCPI
jgi:hypothetical protein